MGLILDTNFVITAEREANRRMAGKVDAFLAPPRLRTTSDASAT
jgi:hypothetical protein